MSAASEQTRSLLDRGDPVLAAAYLLGVGALPVVIGVALVRQRVFLVNEVAET